MTVRLLVDFKDPADGKQYVVGNLYTSAANEAGLIATKQATSDLTGGTAWVDPVVPESIDETKGVNVVLDAYGNVTGLVVPDNKLRKLHRADTPQIFRAASHPLSNLGLYEPVFSVGTTDGKIYGVIGGGAQIGKSFVYDHATGTMTISSATISGGAGTSVVGFFKSSTAVFAACIPAAGTHRKIYRSVDGLTGWTEVFDFAALAGVNPAGGDDPKQWAESDNGNLFIAVYNAQNSNGDAYNKPLLKSTDGGLTWTDISAKLGDGYGLRHTHAVVWDKYRSLLWVAVGDAGDVPSVSVSNDYGATFSVVPASFQTTGIIPTPSAVYITSDRQSVGVPDAGIWRMECASLADALSNPFIRVYDPMMDSGIAYQSTNGAGFAWWGWYDEETGVMYAPYVETTERVRAWAADGASPSYTEAFAALVASSDGWNWQVVATEIKTSTTTSFVRQEQASRPNDYANWDGWHYMGGADTKAAPWCVKPADYEFSLAPTAGYANGDGSASRPMKTIPAQQKESTISSTDWFFQPRRFKLIENTDQPIYLPSDQVILRKQGFDSSYAGVTLLEDQGFEQVGNVAPSASWISALSGAGAITWNSTTQEHGGTQSVLLATTNTADIAAARYNHAAVAEGDWITYEGWFYVDLASMTSGAILLIKGHRGAGVYVVGSSAGPYLQARYTPAGVSADQRSIANARVEFPLQEWVKVTLRVRQSYNSGSATEQYGALEAFQNGVLLCGSTGGMQTANGASPTYVQFGIAALTTLTAVNVYLDDVKIVAGSTLPAQTDGIIAGGKYCRVS